MGTASALPEPSFSNDLSFKYGTSFHFKNINLQFFAILLDNNSIVVVKYLKTTIIIFKNVCEKKTFYQTIKFVFDKLQGKRGSTISGRLHWVTN